MTTSKNNADILENWLKVLSFLLSTVIFFWGVKQYKLENERNFRKFVFEEQSKVYSEYLTICSELATTDKDSTSTKKFKESYSKFEQLHYGKMTLIQDPLVFSSATKFYFQLNSFRQRQSPINNNQLQITIENLSKDCRKSLKETWNGEFDKIFNYEK